MSTSSSSPHNLPDDFDEDDEHQGLQATFDYLSIHAVVVSPAVKHPAYGLPYSEYRKYRLRSTDLEADIRNSKITFYCDNLIGTLVTTLANRRGVSVYSYINDMLEEGQIHFHPEHHEMYEDIKDILDDMQTRMCNDAQARAVQKLRNQKISFNVCMRGAPHFTPRIAYWLMEDIAQVGMILHMSVTDTAYLYLVTGIMYTDIQEMPVNSYQNKIMSNVLQFFDQELNAVYDISKYIHKTFDKITE
jgi:hypothetical protein